MPTHRRADRDRTDRDDRFDLLGRADHRGQQRSESLMEDEGIFYSEDEAPGRAHGCIPELDDEVLVSVVGHTGTAAHDRYADLETSYVLDDGPPDVTVEPVDTMADFAEPIVADDDWEAPAVFIDDDGPGLE